MDTEQFRPQADKVAIYTHIHTQITRMFCQHLTKTQGNNKNLLKSLGS